MVVCELVVSKWIVCPQGPILATRWCHPLSCVSSLTPIRLYIFHEPSWLCLSNTSWTSVTRGITLHGNWTTNKCRYGHILLMSLSITLSMGSSGAKLGIQPTMNTYEYLWKPMNIYEYTDLEWHGCNCVHIYVCQLFFRELIDKLSTAM